ncbi:nucleotidyltransferase domain-containing protein [archaeon]|nr:nucleotidyltransferase domain-containing protein [archaeon]
MDLSRELKQKYFQTYRTIKNLNKTNDVKIKNVGKSKVVKLDLTRCNQNYVLAESERAEDVCKRISLKIVREDLQKISKNFVCVLFGSQVNKPKENSDIDLLFLIPKEYDYGKFENIARNALMSVGNVDVNIAFEESLHEMLAHPEKFNVGNELLKKHVVLYGAEHFLNLLRKHYVG